MASDSSPGETQQKEECDAIEHSGPATTTLQFGDGSPFYRQFCDKHARCALAKHDDAKVIDDE